MIGGSETSKEDGYQWESFFKEKHMEFQQESATQCHAMSSTDNGELSKDFPSMIFQEKEWTKMQKNFSVKERWPLGSEIITR